jgi:outer membrane protein
VQAVQAYTYVIAGREAYLVAQHKVDSLKKIVNQSELKLSVGTITKTNMLEARARLAAAISEKEAAYSNMKDTEENFRYITGDIAPPKMDDINIDKLSLPRSLDFFLEEVERNNQGIVAADKNLIARQFATRSAKTSLLPTVTATAAISNQRYWQGNIFGDPTLQSKNSETYQLSVSIPIFQSGQEYVRIKKAQLEEDAAEVNKDDTVMKTCKDAAAAWNKYNQTKISVQSDKDSVEFYREFARGADEEFQIGTKTLTDLLQAQVQYEDSKIKLIQDRAIMVVSALNMRFLMGDLNKVNFSKLVVKEKSLKKISEVSSDNKLKEQKAT